MGGYAVIVPHGWISALEVLLTVGLLYVLLCEILRRTPLDLNQLTHFSPIWEVVLGAILLTAMEKMLVYLIQWAVVNWSLPIRSAQGVAVVLVWFIFEMTSRPRHRHIITR